MLRSALPVGTVEHVDFGLVSSFYRHGVLRYDRGLAKPDRCVVNQESGRDFTTTRMVRLPVEHRRLRVGRRG